MIRLTCFFSLAGLFLLPAAFAGQPDTETLLARLKDPGENVRLQAVRSLRANATFERPVIEALFVTAKDANLEIRRRSIGLLEKAGDAGKPAVPILLEALKDADAQVRHAALGALASIAPGDHALVPALAEALVDKQSEVRMAALVALKKYIPHRTAGETSAVRSAGVPPASAGETPALPTPATPIAVPADAVVDALVFAASDSEGPIRRLAGDALLALDRPHLRATPVYIQHLKEGAVPAPRAKALRAFNALGPAVVPYLNAALKDKDPGTRREAAALLLKFVPLPAESVEALLAASREGDSYARRQCAETLLAVVPHPEAAAPAYILLLNQTVILRNKAAAALEKLGSQSVPHLIAALKDKDSSIRSEAAGLLVKCGPKCGADVPPLLGALESQDPYVRRGAAEALAALKVPPPDAAPAFVLLLKESAAARNRGLQGLEKLSVAAIPALAAGLAHENQQVRLDATRLLVKVLPQAPEVKEHLFKALKDTDPYVRRAVAEPLARIALGRDPRPPAPAPTATKPGSPPAQANPVPPLPELPESLARLAGDPTLLDAFIEALNDNNEYVKRAALNVLIANAREGKVLDLLVRTRIANSEPGLRRELENAVLKTGSAATSCVPQLVAALQNTGSDLELRMWAAKVLENTGVAGKAGIPALLKMAQEGDKSQRLTAASALGKMAPDSIAPLAEFLKSERDDVRASGAFGLARAGAPAIESLVKLLADGAPATRISAASALEQAGAPAAAAVPALIATLKGSDSKVSVAAADALVRLGLPAVAPLMEELQNPGERRSALLETLGRIGLPAVAPLAEAIARHTAARAAVPSPSGGEGRVRGTPAPASAPPTSVPVTTALPEIALLEALGKIGPKAKEALPVVLRVLDHLPPPAPLPAASEAAPPPPTLNKRGIPLPAAPPAAVTATKSQSAPALDANAGLRVAVAQAIAGMGTEASAALPVLFKQMENSSSRAATSEMARAISRVATGKEALPPLKPILENANADSYSVYNALKNHGDAGIQALIAEFGRTAGVPPAQTGETPAHALLYRQRVAEVLVGFSPACLQPLIDALKAESWQMRQGAALALGEIRRYVRGGNKAQPVLEKTLQPLCEAIRDAHPDVCIAAAWGLGKGAEHKAEDIPFVARALQKCDLELQLRGAYALAGYELEKHKLQAAEAVPVLLQMSGGDNQRRQEARALLMRIGFHPQNLPALIQALRSQSYFMRAAAVKGLEELGAQAGEAVPALIELLGHDDRQGAKGLADALASAGRGNPVELLAAMQGEDPKRRLACVMALKRIKPAADTALPILSGALKDERAEVRCAAVEVLGALSEIERTAPLLQAALNDGDKLVFKAAVDALNNQGLDISAGLIAALQGQNAHIRMRSAMALSKIKIKPDASAPIVAALLGALKDENAQVRMAAVESLGAFKSAAQLTVPALALTLQDDDPLIRRAVLNVLEEHAAGAPAVAVPALARALKDEVPAIRRNAAGILADLGAESRPAAPALLEALKDAERRVRASAAKALLAAGLAEEPAVRAALNEMRALEAVEAYSDLQVKFRVQDPDGDGVKDYARNLAELKLDADIIAAEGPPSAPEAPAYAGYRFLILKRQGPNAPGGKREFLVDGNMLAGHALVAYPAVYGAGGRYSLLTGEDGAIYQKDLEANTAKAIEQMTEFNPDETWVKIRTPDNQVDENPRFQTPVRDPGNLEF